MQGGRLLGVSLASLLSEIQPGHATDSIPSQKEESTRVAQGLSRRGRSTLDVGWHKRMRGQVRKMRGT